MSDKRNTSHQLDLTAISQLGGNFHKTKLRRKIRNKARGFSVLPKGRHAKVFVTTSPRKVYVGPTRLGNKAPMKLVEVASGPVIDRKPFF